MNSSLQRCCAARGRYIHVSKPIVMEQVELLPAREIGGIAYPAMTVQRPAVSRDPGITAALGIRKVKRLYPNEPHADVRAFKDLAWDACREVLSRGG